MGWISRQACCVDRRRRYSAIHANALQKVVSRLSPATKIWYRKSSQDTPLEGQEYFWVVNQWFSHLDCWRSVTIFLLSSILAMLITESQCHESFGEFEKQLTDRISQVAPSPDLSNPTLSEANLDRTPLTHDKPYSLRSRCPYNLHSISNSTPDGESTQYGKKRRYENLGKESSSDTNCSGHTKNSHDTCYTNNDEGPQPTKRRKWRLGLAAVSQGLLSR